MEKAWKYHGNPWDIIMEYKHGGIWGMIFGLSRAFSGTIWVHIEHDACFRKTCDILLKYGVKCLFPGLIQGHEIWKPCASFEMLK